MSRLPVIPRALQQGECIGFLSPSARLNEAFEPSVSRAKAELERLGYRVKVFWTSRTPKTTIESIKIRIAELRAAFLDAEVRAIICTIGGSTATELLPTLINDKELIQDVRANPKVFVGYSDITVLHWWLAACTGLRTFYGPTIIPELGTLPPLSFTMDHLIRIITPAGSKPFGALPQSESYSPALAPFFDDPESEELMTLAPTPKRKWLRGGRGTGILFGGCMPVVVRLLGVTSIVPSWEEKVLFLETAMAENSTTEGFRIENIRRVLADLAAAGVWDKVSGLVIGRCFGYDSPEQRAQLEKTVADALGLGEENDKSAFGRNKAFPILMHVDIGHTNPMLTLPMGTMVSLDSEKDEFAVLEATVA